MAAQRWYNVDDQNAAIDKFIAEYKAGTEILLRLYNRDYPLTNIDEDGIVYFSGYIYDAANKSVGVVTYKMEKNKAVVEESSLYGIKAISLDNQLKYKDYAADAKAVGDALGTKLNKNQGAGNAGKILGIGEDGIVVPQNKPTYTLPQATADALGGIKADAATAEDTQVVRIGKDGKLRTKPSGSTVTVDSALSSTSENPLQNKVVTAALAGKITAPTTAAVGQIIKVKSVDGTGKPTEWEAVELPSGGGGGTYRLVSDTTLAEATNLATITQDKDGNAFELTDCLVWLFAAVTEETAIQVIPNGVWMAGTVVSFANKAKTDYAYDYLAYCHGDIDGFYGYAIIDRAAAAGTNTFFNNARLEKTPPKKLTSVKISGKFAAGARILIYGR